MYQQTFNSYINKRELLQDNTFNLVTIIVKAFACGLFDTAESLSSNLMFTITESVYNRPIQGYRRHVVKGAKPLGRARGQTNGDSFEAFTIPKHARCCVGFCDNEKRFPNLLVVRSHVKELKFHRWPKDPNLAELWRKQVAKGRSDNFSPWYGSEGTFVYSNHFPEGTRTRHNPSADYPSVFLTVSDFLNKPSPRKRKVS